MWIGFRKRLWFERMSATSFQTSSKKATPNPIPPAPHSALPFRLMRWGGGSQGCILLYKWTNNFSSCFTPEKKYIKVIPLYTKKENHENHCCAVKIDPEMKARMKRLAVSRRRSTHWLMKEAISQYVEREEKQESFRQDGIRAWNEYQATGLHVTSEEADAWLAELEEGKSVEPPKCHI